MINAAAFHEQYASLLRAFSRQLPDAGLRVLLRQEGDAFFRRCALYLWKTDERSILPSYTEYYNGIYSESAAESVLYWELTERVTTCPAPEIPAFFRRMVRYDRETGRSTARRFLQSAALLLPLLAAADGEVTPTEGVCMQEILDRMSALCDENGLSGAPVTVSGFVNAPNNTPPEKKPAASSAPAAPEKQKAAEPKPEEKEPTTEELLSELDSLCGLKTVKEDVHSLINLVRVRKLRESAGLDTPPLSLHMVFRGSPGTGKTTVARLLAKIYKTIGVLSKGQLVEVDRSGLVAGFVGQTALKTGEVITKALGGVLFIDEAYSLTSAEGGQDFGREAIEVLLKSMEDHRDDLIVIVAGYTDLMEKFIHSNPGLESRFNKYLTFADYTGEELMEIFRSLCKKNQYTLTPEAEEKAAAGFLKMYENKDENFGNARQVRNVFEKAVSHQADRVAAIETPDKETLMALTAEDLLFSEN